MGTKIDSKQFYDFVLAKTGSKEEARTMVLINAIGKMFYKASCLAEERHGINLMPPDCIVILEEVYGKRMQTMSFKNIVDKVCNLMKQVEGNPCKEICKEVVNDWMNTN